MTVVPVVPAVRVRRLDRAVRLEPRLGVGAKLRDVLEQHLRLGETADEQLEEEALARTGLDRLEPVVEARRPARVMRVELFVGTRRLRHDRRCASPSFTSRGKTA